MVRDKIMDKIEKFCVWISRRIFLVFLIISALTGIALSAYIGIQWLMPAKTFEADKSGAFSEYRLQKELEHTSKYKTEQKQNIKAGKKQKQISPVLLKAEEILKNINNYSEIMGEEPVNREKFFRYLGVIPERNLSESDLPEILSILTDLEKQTASMLKFAPEMKNLPVRDKRRIYSRDFIGWYFNELKKAKEQAKVKTAKALADREASKTAALALLPDLSQEHILPIAGCIVLGFLILIILLRIDWGIRLISKQIESSSQSNSK